MDPVDNQEVDLFRTTYGDPIIKTYRKTPPTEQIYDNIPTFREFVQYVTDTPWNQFNSHWYPIYMLCMPCHIDYTIIGKMDTIETDSKNLFKALKINATLPHYHKSNANKSSPHVKTYFNTLDRDLLNKLVHMYKPDFYLFDYSYQEYFTLIS